MNYPSPSPLRVGMAGTLNGRRYTVLGHAVLSTEDANEVYYWQEFILVDDAGVQVTLVFEETEYGMSWKLFNEFVPTRPLTLAEAAAKRLGHTADCNGRSARVTYAGRSRVMQAEGQMPEDMTKGSTAAFFNADVGGEEFVVSWSNGALEYFRGKKLPAQAVTTAFGLGRAVLDYGRPVATRRALASDEDENENQSSAQQVGTVITVLLVLVAIGVAAWHGGQPPTVAPAAAQSAPSLRLRTGARGALAGKTWAVAGRTVVEVAGVGGKFGRVEYDLTADDGARARLVHAFDGDAHDWRLLTPVPTPADLTPFRAAARRPSEPVALGWRGDFVVRGLFRSRRLSAEGRGSDLPANGSEAYGFVARDGNETLLARWNETNVILELGRAVPEKEVLAALQSDGG